MYMATHTFFSANNRVKALLIDTELPEKLGLMGMVHHDER